MSRVLAALLLIPSLLSAQQPNVAAIADTVFARWNTTHGPGCAVGVARGGKVLLTRGYGMADLESGTPISAETIFESGSVAKQFTAAATVLLALDSKLDLVDPAGNTSPSCPTTAGRSPSATCSPTPAGSASGAPWSRLKAGSGARGRTTRPRCSTRCSGRSRSTTRWATTTRTPTRATPWPWRWSSG
jgi:hypothetical protein